MVGKKGFATVGISIIKASNIITAFNNYHLKKLRQAGQDKMYKAFQQVQEDALKRNKQDDGKEDRIDVIYARVSLMDQKEDLRRQVERLMVIVRGERCSPISGEE